MPWDVAGVTCEDQELELKLVISASVGTFQNHSQLYGFSDVGWMCVDEETGHYYLAPTLTPMAQAASESNLK